MTKAVLLASMLAGALGVPGLVAAPPAIASDLEIRQITVRPGSPVVGPDGAVKLVIDVVARGAEGKDGVTIKVEPGAPPQPVIGSWPRHTGPVQGGDPFGPVPLVPDAPDQEPADTGTAGAGEDAQDPANSGAPDVREPASVKPPVVRKPAGAKPVRKPAGVKPPVVRKPEGVNPPEVREPEGVNPPEVREPEGVNPPEVREPEGVKPPEVREPEGATPPEVREPEGGQMSGNEGGTVPEVAPRSGDAAALLGEGMAGAPAPRPLLRWPPLPSREEAAAMDALAAMGAMRLADEWETWRFLPARGLNRFYPAGAWTITATAKDEHGQVVTEYQTFELKHQTRLRSVEAERVHGKRGVRLQGTLTRVDPRGYTDYAPFAGQRLEIEHRREGGDWAKAATVTTTATGRFARTLPARAHGTWRVRFEGTNKYAPIQKIT